MKKLLLILGLMLAASPVYAQTIGQNVIPGFMSAAGTNGCPATNACFVPYSDTNPLPVTGGSGPGSEVDLTGINGVAPSVGNGATNTGTLRVTVASDSPSATAAKQDTGNTSLAAIEGAIGDPIPDCGANPCTNHIGLADQGRAGTDPWAVALKGATTGGATGAGYVSTASTNATNVKNAAGTVKAMNFINTTTTIGYVRMYNLSSAPTCSSATGYVRTWPVPPGASAGLAGGLAAQLAPEGTAFSTGIGFCITGGGSSTDNTNAPAGIYFNIDYF